MAARLAFRLLAELDGRLLWRVPGASDEVYLTFDDGPHPEVTPWVLGTLAAHGAKATFFCLGQQAEQHPGLVERIRQEGHVVGHHSWNHPNGWLTATEAYVDNVMRGAEQLGGELFRPPYGRITPAQLKALAPHYRIVMWDVMGGDFKPGRTGLACSRHVLDQGRPGSIIVLHDNLKSASCLRSALVPILEGFAAKGLRCAPLTPSVTARPRR